MQVNDTWHPENLLTRPVDVLYPVARFSAPLSVVQSRERMRFSP